MAKTINVDGRINDCLILGPEFELGKPNRPFDWFMLLRSRRASG
jgi:hypothetical protein